MEERIRRALGKAKGLNRERETNHELDDVDSEMFVDHCTYPHRGLP